MARSIKKKQRWDGLGKNKEIKRVRRKPIPQELMRLSEDIQQRIENIIIEDIYEIK